MRKRARALGPVWFLSAVCTLWSANAAAGIITYDDRSAWTTAAGTPSWTVDFNGFVQDTTFAGGSLSLGPFTLSEVAEIGFGGSPLANLIDVAPFYGFPGGYWGQAPIDSTPYALITTTNYSAPTNMVVDVTFAAGVGAWGSDLRQSSLSHPISVDLFLVNGSFFTTLAIPWSAGGPPGFFGFQTTGGESIGRMRFYSQSGPSSFGLDNVSGVVAGGGPVTVPEPTSLSLLSAGIVLLGCSVRCRNARAPLDGVIATVVKAKRILMS